MGTTETPSASPRFELHRSDSGSLRISLKGRLDVRTAPAIRDDLLSRVDASENGSVVADLSEISYMDDFGALLLSELRQRAESAGRTFSLDRIPDKVENILSLVQFGDDSVCRPLPRPERQGAVVRLGRTALRHAFNTRYLVSFLGSAIIALLSVLLRPKTLRWEDTLTQMEKTGVDALPIVGLIGFLLGLVMAFTSALQLEQFGANIYVASLVALAMVSELGPIMTAIVVAGRSGSAFAAGTANRLRFSRNLTAAIAAIVEQDVARIVGMNRFSAWVP